MITHEMWEDSLEENIKKSERTQRESALQTKMVGQAMSEIKSDPRWKIYADHIMSLYNESVKRSKTSGELALESTKEEEAAAHRQDYLTFKQRAFTYDHVLKLLEALIERGETTKEELEGVDYGEARG